MSIMKTMATIVLAAAAAIVVPQPEPAAAQACEACDDHLRKCVSWIDGNTCLAGEHPDGLPFCGDQSGSCQQTLIDINVQGTPLMGLPPRAYAATSEDVRRSCDGAIIYYAPPEETRAIEALTAQLVI
jgi:hypothetical protein